MPSGEEKVQGGKLINIYKYLKGGCKENGTRLFSVVPRNRSRGNGHQLEHRRFPLKIRRDFLTMQVSEHWHRLLRVVVKSPSLEILKSHLG